MGMNVGRLAALRSRRTALALTLVLATAPALGQGAPSYQPLGPIVVSRPNGYDYAYAPVLIREGEGWRAFFCSTGHGVNDWDWIRTATSADGQSWSAPQVVLKPSGGDSERAACDPSLVHYQAPGDSQPFYYLFYSGAPNGTGAAMFVARAPEITGPYAKWTGSGWVVDAPNPKPIIRPAVPHPDGSGFYGAGQQSVIVKDGRLRSWFTDDTSCNVRCERIFTAETADPTAWPAATPTNVGGASIDVKLDPRSGRFIMYMISGSHSFSSYLVRRTSADGVTWDRPEIVAGPTAFTHYASNPGLGGDDRGHLVPGDLLVAFAGPSRPDCGVCWAHWDLYGATIASDAAVRP